MLAKSIVIVKDPCEPLNDILVLITRIGSHNPIS